MRTVFKPLFLVALLLVVSPVLAQRSGNTTQSPTLDKGEGLEKTRSDLDKMRNQNQDKNSRQVDIYMFAASFSMLDSVLYVSDIQKMDNVIVNNKWFVKERAAFEAQFTEYVSPAFNGSQMTSIYFSEKLKNVERRKARLLKRNSKKNRFYLIEKKDFRFSNPSTQSSGI